MIHFSEIAFKIFVWVLEICGNEDILYLSTEREQALTVRQGILYTGKLMAQG